MPTFENDGRGAILDGSTRYVLMRPDVLMGTVKHLPTEMADSFFAAFEQSAFVNARASFQLYKDSGQFGSADFLEASADVANSLGWGRWSIERSENGVSKVQVENSPFAAGHGSAERVVCSPISGILRAIALVGYGQEMSVRETCCAAQGAEHCSFEITKMNGDRG